ncbi:MAG: hypothetical protein U5N53_27675 [Mycobacterium sp.]|nr:hypothetical protein [Mycobacterium sp.]
MAGKHRNVAERTRRVAVVTAAAATATALTVGAAAPTPPPRPEEHYLRVVEQQVDLSAAVSPFGPPGSLSDVTGGSGQAAYNTFQEFIAAYEQALAGVNLAGGFGLNIENLLGQIPTAFLDDILGAIPIDLGSVLTPILGGLVTPLLINILDLLNITDAQGNITLSAVLGLVGPGPVGPLNLAGLNIPGVNIITPGEPFLLLKMLAGLDLGWTPGTANAVADAINQTPYLEVGVENLLDAVLDLAGNAVGNIPLLGPLISAVLQGVEDINLPDLNVIDVRIPIVIGYGFGAMAAGSAYEQALADLGNQPRLGANGGGPLGSLTLLPMILANNVGRANGGMLARFYPLFELLGIDMITPDVQATNAGTGIPILGTGIELGAANLVPIKVDATVQYQPYSDFAAWPNPFTLFNNLLAGTIGASYILRGVELDSALDQILDEVGETVSDALDLGNPLNINIYLTLATSTLPLLEPLYLAGDLLNMVSFGTLGTLPIRLANALAPAMTSLVNLGYTDVVRNPDGTYTRTLDDPDTATPFMSFPDVNWGRAINDVLTSLTNGFHKEFISGNPTAAPPNVLENLGKLIQTLTKGLNLGGLTAGLQEGLDNLVAGLTGQAGRQSPNAARTLAAAGRAIFQTPMPSSSPLSVDPDGDVPTAKHAANPSAAIPEDSGLAPKHAAPDDAEAEETPVESETPSEAETPAETPTEPELEPEPEAVLDTEANPDAEAEAPAVKKPTVKKNPLQNVVRDITNALTPKKKKPAATTSGAGDTETDAKKSETSETKVSETKKSETMKADKAAA